MAKEEKKKWNRCDYCGRFIGLKEFAEGTAKRTCYYTQSSSWEPETEERYDTYHIACRED